MGVLRPLDCTIAETTRTAAKELAGCESRFAKIETDLAVVKWMLGLVMAGVVSLVIKAFV